MFWMGGEEEEGTHAWTVMEEQQGEEEMRAEEGKGS